MNLIQKISVGASLIGVLTGGCIDSGSGNSETKVSITGPVDVNIDQQNRGTVRGKTLINGTVKYQTDNVYTPQENVRIKFRNSSKQAYEAKSSRSGDFLIDLPSGAYDISSCYKQNDYDGNKWCAQSSIVVMRGDNTNLGEMKLKWDRSCPCF